MNTKHLFLMVLIVLAMLAAVGCSKAASTPPPTDALSVPATQQNMGEAGNAAMTQTAQPTAPPQPQPTQPPAITPTAVAVEPTAVPPAVPPVVQPTPQPIARPEKYTLEKDEFPYCIARRFDVNPDELLRINSLTKGSVYYAGLELKIPAGGSFPGERALKDHPVQYTVKAGDSIYSIACAFGDIAPETIGNYNGLAAPYTLTVGQVLDIP